MSTGQEWLFKSVLDTIIKPLMPIRTFLAWIIGSYVLILGFMRRFHAKVSIYAKRKQENPLMNQLAPRTVAGIYHPQKRKAS